MPPPPRLRTHACNDNRYHHCYWHRANPSLKRHLYKETFCSYEPWSAITFTDVWTHPELRCLSVRTNNNATM